MDPGRVCVVGVHEDVVLLQLSQTKVVGLPMHVAVNVSDAPITGLTGLAKSVHFTPTGGATFTQLAVIDVGLLLPTALVAVTV